MQEYGFDQLQCSLKVVRKSSAIHSESSSNIKVFYMGFFVVNIINNNLFLCKNLVMYRFTRKMQEYGFGTWKGCPKFKRHFLELEAHYQIFLYELFVANYISNNLCYMQKCRQMAP